jgi:hypothetical protein
MILPDRYDLSSANAVRVCYDASRSDLIENNGVLMWIFGQAREREKQSREVAAAGGAFTDFPFSC